MALLDRPQLVVATKRDAVANDDPLPRLRAHASSLGLELMAVSAVTGEGLVALERRLLALVDTSRASDATAEETA